MDFEKVHIGESEENYILLAIAQPDKYMKMDREQWSAILQVITRQTFEFPRNDRNAMS